MSRFRFRTVRAAAAAAGLLLASPAPAALAQDTDESVENVLAPFSDQEVEMRSERVGIAVNELADQAGRDAVMARIGRAVRRVCRFDETGTLSERSAYEVCHDNSLADAMGQLRVLMARNATGPMQVALARPGG